MCAGKGPESAHNRKFLWPCMKCPRAYHENCIPPSSKYHEYLLLCPEHCHLTLPRLPGDQVEHNVDIPRDRVSVLSLPKVSKSRGRKRRSSLGPAHGLTGGVSGCVLMVCADRARAGCRWSCRL